MSISLYERRSMLIQLDELLEPKTFMTNKFFSKTEEVDTIKVDVDIIKNDRRILPYVSRNTEGTNVERTGYTTDTYEPPLLKPKMTATESDQVKRQPGSVIYSSGQSAEEKQATSIAKDLEKLDKKIQRNEEVQSTQALLNGTFTPQDLDGNAIGDGLDYQREDSHTLSLNGVKLWSASTADPLRDLRDWKRLCVKDSGISSRIAIMGSTAFDKFILHENVLKIFNRRRGDDADRIAQQEIGGATFEGKIGGFEVWTYDEWYKDINGTLQPMIPLTKVLLASDEGDYVKVYGGQYDAEADIMHATARLPSSWTEKDPSVRWVMLAAAPMMLPKQVDSTLLATVL